jgi:hypothetical protein
VATLADPAPRTAKLSSVPGRLSMGRVELTVNDLCGGRQHLAMWAGALDFATCCFLFGWNE